MHIYWKESGIDGCFREHCDGLVIVMWNKRRDMENIMKWTAKFVKRKGERTQNTWKKLKKRSQENNIVFRLNGSLQLDMKL